MTMCAYGPVSLAHNRTMTFSSGDVVHVAALGKGIVRDVRNGGRYRVEIKGRLLDVAGTQLTLSSPGRTPRRTKRPVGRAQGGPAAVEQTPVPPSLDLHGTTVHEALDALNAFLNAVLIAGNPEARIVHGRSGGRLKAAVHAHLKLMPSIRGFGLDPRNHGVTIIRL
jgi:DNA mismatch repair protein MutS2